MPNTKSAHVHWGSWDFDYDVAGFESLCLLNATYRGRRAFGKFSMPAIRVKYRVDGGALDWRRPLSKGAGPYADRMRWKLGGDYGLQKISNRGDEYVGFLSYVVDSRQWMELSIYGRIGKYHLAQQWHLSEDGWVAPRIWSKGLTINMDHHHHPYWRFDFDIDGTDQNRVYRIDRSTNDKRFYSKEANDLKNPEVDRVWRVQNEVTGQGAWIFPGPNDGVADDFSRIDVGIRRYIQAEELTPWRYEKSWTGSWDWQFDTGGLGFLNGENVDKTDIVFWYITHMFHHAHEGNDHWGWSGPWIKFDFNVEQPPLPKEFGISVNITRNQLGNTTTIKGWGFTPGGWVALSFVGIPNRPTITRFRTADANGKFNFIEDFEFTSRNHDDGFANVQIYAFDKNTGHTATRTVTAAYWVP